MYDMTLRCKNIYLKRFINDIRDLNVHSKIFKNNIVEN